MGDALVDTINDCFKLKENKDRRRGCPKCGGTIFRVTLAPEVWTVDLAHEGSCPDTAFGQAGPEVGEAVCTNCEFKLEEEV